MFTGIIEATGTISDMSPRDGDLRVTVNCESLDLSAAKLGDSIAVNGICLTIVHFNHSGFSADVSRETLARTCFHHYKKGLQVNLEQALTLASRLGGHIVSGHVDGVGTIKSLSSAARSVQLEIEIPPQLNKYISEKGSVCVDGVSLTVNKIVKHIMEVNIVPHTQERTGIAAYNKGQEVNIEVDLLARYLERLMLKSDSSGSNINREFLSQHGFT